VTPSWVDNYCYLIVEVKMKIYIRKMMYVLLIGLQLSSVFVGECFAWGWWQKTSWDNPDDLLEWNEELGKNVLKGYEISEEQKAYADCWNGIDLRDKENIKNKACSELVFKINDKLNSLNDSSCGLYKNHDLNFDIMNDLEMLIKKFVCKKIRNSNSGQDEYYYAIPISDCTEVPLRLGGKDSLLRDLIILNEALKYAIIEKDIGARCRNMEDVFQMKKPALDTFWKQFRNWLVKYPEKEIFIYQRSKKHTVDGYLRIVPKHEDGPPSRLFYPKGDELTYGQDRYNVHSDLMVEVNGEDRKVFTTLHFADDYDPCNNPDVVAKNYNGPMSDVPVKGKKVPVHFDNGIKGFNSVKMPTPDIGETCNVGYQAFVKKYGQEEFDKWKLNDIDK
jgi:hypothetical protein